MKLECPAPGVIPFPDFDHHTRRGFYGVNLAQQVRQRGALVIVGGHGSVERRGAVNHDYS